MVITKGASPLTDGKLEETVLECHQCPYATKLYKRKFVGNAFNLHKDKNDLDLFRCDQCSFERNWKVNLRAHKKCILVSYLNMISVILRPIRKVRYQAIIFSDESTFCLDGQVNRHNCTYWAR